MDQNFGILEDLAAALGFKTVLPAFNGFEVDKWLSECEKRLRLGALPQTMWVTRCSLFCEGAATFALGQFSEKTLEKLTWAEFCTAFRKTFRSPDYEDDLRKTLSGLSCSCLSMEALLQYASTFLSLTESSPFSPPELVRCFLRGLPAEVRTYIKLHKLDACEKWSDVLDCARQYVTLVQPAPSVPPTVNVISPRGHRGDKSFRNSDRSRRRSVSSSSSSSQRGRRRYNSPGVPQRTRPSSPAVTCWECGRPGHYAKQCPQRAFQSQRSRTQYPSYSGAQSRYAPRRSAHMDLDSLTPPSSNHREPRRDPLWFPH